ncbi:MAG: hypothetical protein ABEK59_02435 [Halobacteria archaeon]
MSEVEERLREQIEEDVSGGNVECPGCGATDLEPEVWGVGDVQKEPRGAAVCRECGVRLNIPLSLEDVQELR